MTDSTDADVPETGAHGRVSAPQPAPGVRGGQNAPDASEGRVGPFVTPEDSRRFQQWLATGRIRCADCGTTVRTETLASLPPHCCAERQAVRPAPDAAHGHTGGPECRASTSGLCFREALGETACDTGNGECVHGGQPAPEPGSPVEGAADPGENPAADDAGSRTCTTQVQPFDRGFSRATVKTPATSGGPAGRTATRDDEPPAVAYDRCTRAVLTAVKPYLDRLTAAEQELARRDAAAPEPAPDREQLRQQYADAIHKALRDYGEGDYDPGTGSDYGDQTAAVMAVRDAELEQLRDRVEDWKIAARGDIRQTQELRDRAERAEATLARGIPLICDDERHHAKVAALESELEQARAQVAIDTEVMEKADRECDEHIAAGRAFRQQAEQALAWGEQHRDRANRYRARLDAAKAVHVRNPNTGDCEHCSENDYPNYAVPHPCATIRALDGTEQPTDGDRAARIEAARIRAHNARAALGKPATDGTEQPDPEADGA